MGDNTTPTDHESHPTSDAVYTDNESEMGDLNIEEESAFSEMDVSQKQSGADLSEIDNAGLNPSDTALSQMDDTGLNPSTNASTEAVRNSSSEVDSEYTGSSAPRLLINVSGTLGTGLWHRRLNMEEGSGKPSILAKWRAGLNVKPIRRTNDELNEEGTLDVQGKEDHEPIEADTKETKLPSFVTSVKDRMSIFRGKKTFKCLGKLFVNLHEKFIEECEKRDKIHRSYLDDRTIDERSLEKRRNMLKQARKEALIVNTEGKLFGRDVMALEKENPLTARIKAEVLGKYVAVSPMETKACSDKMPVQLFVRKVVEEHATVVFGRSSCIICIKLLTLLMDAGIKHLSLRLDKMGGYGDSIYEFLRKEYTDNLPANVYFHESHPNFVKKSFSVVEQNSDSDAMVGLFPDTYDLIVIGGTSLGLQAVYEARKMDLKVCLIESPLVASATKPICLLGKSTLSEPDVSKKILYHLLSLRIRARKYQEEYCPDSNQKIHSDWAKLADSAQSLIAKICLQNVQSVHNVGGAFLKTGVKFVDHHTVEVTNPYGENYNLRSSFFIMANPMEHRVPYVPGNQYFYTPDQLFSLPNSPGKTLIYGGTKTAMECASLLGSMGFPVTLVAPGKIMEECDSDIVTCIKDTMKQYGITVIDNCVLKSVKLVADSDVKYKEPISSSDETLYKFAWNPLINKSRIKKKQPRYRGRLQRNLEIDKLVEQALLTWEVSPKVLRAIVEAGPAMRELEEEHGVNKFDAVAHSKKVAKLKRQAAAIRKWFTQDNNDDDRCFGRLKLPNSRPGLVRNREFRGAGGIERTGRRRKNKKDKRDDVLRKFVTLFLASCPDERIMTSLEVNLSKKSPLRRTNVRYGPHYSYSRKSRVGVYFPGGTALKLSKGSKYYKSLRPIKPFRRCRRKKLWPLSVCRPAEEVIASLDNLKTSLQETVIEEVSGKTFSELKGSRIDSIVEEYNKKHFDIMDIFKSNAVTADANGSVVYKLDHPIFKEYIVLVLKNIDETVKKMSRLSREVEFKSQCLKLIGFFSKLVQTLGLFHLYINWKVKDCRIRFKKPSKKQKTSQALKYLHENLAIQLECRVIRNSVFDIIKNLEGLMVFVFCSACHSIVEESSGSITDSAESSTRDRERDDSPRHNSRRSRRGKNNRSYKTIDKEGQVPFNFRRFYNKSRYIRTCMGATVDLYDPYLPGNFSGLCFEGNQPSPFGSTSLGDPATKSSVRDLNSQLKGLIARVKSVNTPILSEISENIISRLKKEIADKKAAENEPEMSEEKITCEKDALVSSVVFDLREHSPLVHTLPDLKKIEDLRIRGVRSQIVFTEFMRFKSNKTTPKIVTSRFDSMKKPEGIFSNKNIELGEKSASDIKIHNRTTMTQIINEKGSRTQKNLKDDKTKLNFRTFVANNFGGRYKLKCSMSQRDKHLSTLIARSDAKAKGFKPFRWTSLAAYQDKVKRDRNAFLQALKEKQKVPQKPRSIYFKYGVCDSICQRIGLSSDQPRYTKSLISLIILHRQHPQLLKSPSIDNTALQPSVTSFGSVTKEIYFGTDNLNQSSNYLNKILQSKSKIDDFSSKQGEIITKKLDMKSGLPSKLEKNIHGQSLPVVDFGSLNIVEECREEPKADPNESILKKVIKIEIEESVESQSTPSLKLSDMSTTSTSDLYSFTVTGALTEMEISSTISIDSYIKGEIPVADLSLIGSTDEDKNNSRPSLSKYDSLDLFSNSQDRCESSIKETNEGTLAQKEETSVVLPSDDLVLTDRNLADQSTRPPKSAPSNKDDGILQKDGARKKPTTSSNIQPTESRKKRRKVKKAETRQRRKSLSRDELQLQQLYRGLSEDALRHGIVPLDGRSELQYQLEQRLRKIRDEAKSFTELLEGLKQYAILSRIVKLCKLQERYKKKGVKKPAKIEPKLFENHSIYKVIGKHKNPLRKDLKENFNTIIAAGRQMCPAQDINFQDIGLTTCPMNGKIYTNSIDQSTVPTVYGIGECVYGWPFENHGSVIAAQYLVRRLFSDFEDTPEVQLCIGSVQTYPLQYAFIGLNEAEARRRYRNVVVYTGSFRTSPSELHPDEIPSTLKFICNLESPGMERVLGIHFYNEDAADTIQGYAAAMKNGLYYNEVQDFIAICPVNTDCVFELKMDRKEYENLEIHESSQADSFESYSSSHNGSSLPHEDLESICPEENDHLEEITRGSGDSDDDESYSSEYTDEGSLIEEEGIPEYLPEEEINEDQEEILEEEEEEEGIEEIYEEEEGGIYQEGGLNSNAAEEDNEESKDGKESVESADKSVYESVTGPFESVEDTVISSEYENDRLTTASSEAQYASICSTEDGSDTTHYTHVSSNRDTDGGGVLCLDGGGGGKKDGKLVKENVGTPLSASSGSFATVSSNSSMAHCVVNREQNGTAEKQQPIAKTQSCYSSRRAFTKSSTTVSTFSEESGQSRGILMYGSVSVGIQGNRKTDPKDPLGFGDGHKKTKKCVRFSDASPSQNSSGSALYRVGSYVRESDSGVFSETRLNQQRPCIDQDEAANIGFVWSTESNSINASVEIVFDQSSAGSSISNQIESSDSKFGHTNKSKRRVTFAGVETLPTPQIESSESSERESDSDAWVLPPTPVGSEESLDQTGNNTEYNENGLESLEGSQKEGSPTKRCDGSGPLGHLHSFDSYRSLQSDHQPKCVVQQPRRPGSTQRYDGSGPSGNLQSFDSFRSLPDHQPEYVVQQSGRPGSTQGSDGSGPLGHLHSFGSHGSLLSDHEPKYIVQQSAPATKQALPVPGALENIKSCESCKHLVMTPSIANIRKKSYLPRKNIVKKDATAQTSRTMFTFAGSSARDHSASSKLEKRLSTEVPQTSAQNLQGTVQPNTAATNVAPDHSASSRTSTEVPQTSAQNVQGTLQPNTPATNADVASTRSGNVSSSESFRRLRLTTAYKLRMALEKIKGKSADKK